MSRIPLVDLAWQLGEIREEVQAGFDAVMERGAYILGQEVADFEEAFARASGVAHCIGVGNGTDAIELVLRALDIGADPARGDEVIVPANTFAASALAVARAGATPVFCDCRDDFLIDPEAARARIGPRTRAILAVDLFGQVAPMSALATIAEEAGIHLLEDAAQAQGARQAGRPAGSFGAASATSFYPGKNLGAFGDAGAVTTDRPELAARIRALRQYGSDRKYHHPELGFNSRLDTLQAVVLSAKLRRLDAWNELRRAAAARYAALLAGVRGIALPRECPGNHHVWHLYAVRVPAGERDRLLETLRAQEIEAGIHYPVPVHLLGAFRHLGHARGDFPESERAADELLSLPLYPGIDESRQARVVEVLAGALRSNAVA